MSSSQKALFVEEASSLNETFGGSASVVMGKFSAPGVPPSCALASQFRALGAPVFLVRVAFPVGPAALRLTTDASPPLPAVEPPDWYDLALEPQPSDVFIHKRHWGAFYGTDLDLQLRRRRIETIVLGGIATNFGVESTARFAHELGYEQIFAEDAMASFTKANHDFAIQNILPRLGRVRVVGEILPALREGK